ncbi:MAG: hypothetical protein K2Y22_14065 [Candidatus Obscuribacterales bacterium]|nr:hypothetical protein [Candidatus Obscuribacterales bacterium]
MNYSDQFWKYTQEPCGSCPLQAEGTLISGEKFYFRLEYCHAGIFIADMKARHGLDNPIWTSSASVPTVTRKVPSSWHDENYAKEDITEAIESLLMDYVLSVEGKDFDENEVVDLAKWRRRQHIKKQLEQNSHQ